MATRARQRNGALETAMAILLQNQAALAKQHLEFLDRSDKRIAEMEKRNEKCLFIVCGKPQARCPKISAWACGDRVVRRGELTAAKEASAATTQEKWGLGVFFLSATPSSTLEAA